jgi:monomeric isocitrate dehydrogenase
MKEKIVDFLCSKVFQAFCLAILIILHVIASNSVFSIVAFGLLLYLFYGVTRHLAYMKGMSDLGDHVGNTLDDILIKNKTSLAKLQEEVLESKKEKI